jgi:hypothetical protein
MDINKTLAQKQTYQLHITSRIIIKKKQLKQINLGTIECSQYVNINATLFEDCTFALINCKIEL